MLGSIMRVVYIDPEWAFVNTCADLMLEFGRQQIMPIMCFNLIYILDAETQGHLNQPQLTMEDLFKELDDELDDV